MEADSNADQRLSLSEIVAAARAEVGQSQQSTNGRGIDSIMAFDVNADGQVDVAEVAAVLAAIDPADFETTRRLPITQQQSAQTCDAPRPSGEADVVFLSGYNGAAVSTLAVSGQDRDTTVATIAITDGTAPLYIFATVLDSVVWKFDGATERVQKLVVQPRTIATGPGAAVSGIPGENITLSRRKAALIVT